MPDALHLQNISKWYDGHRAVDDLSLTVPAGSIYGILGPNGAGKSSTIRTALNIISRDGGEVRILGNDPAETPQVLRRVGYLPEERGLYRSMRVMDVIVFFARLKGMTARQARADAVGWLERMGLTDWRRSKVETLSKGMQQKVQFITTVLHRPDLLFLDEPSAGLDPVNQDLLRETIGAVREEGRTVIFSTHNMSEAERLCDSVCIISRGKKVLDGRLDDIRRANLGNRWRIEFDEVTVEASAIFSRADLFAGIEKTRHGWEVTLPSGESPRSLMTALVGMESLPTRFEQVRPSLHEIFVDHVGGTASTPQKRGETHA